MNNFDALNAAVAELSGKVDELVARPPVEVDHQAEIDAATDGVKAITAKIPAAPAA